MNNHPYAEFLHQVEKPARYIGGEYNATIKDWDSVDATMALCFPDVYDIGMSHLGTKILYSLINKTDDLLMERAFCPWTDMEEKLRETNLPILSLENHKPLCDFDIVGFSLQYELTFTNILTMLDLGHIPLYASDRTLEDPLIVAGGPVATHPEPIAPFFDIILIGDAEERLPQLMRHYGKMKREGKLTRLEMLIEISKEGGVYCPALYERELCERSGLMYVSKPAYDGVPNLVERAFLDDISRYKFPSDSPVPVAEAIFDRMSIEIARGCTEGCRFCQAGMIYRPVRERDPEEVIDTVMTALDESGYDEAAITSLSTADYSCISPLIKQLMERLRPRKVGLGISSLRAYGLDEDLLDEISSVKATGLTFAPEAGSQRMRDVVNKNIDEDDIYTTCHRVFSRGWRKIKLYFMIGLPTEEDADVLAIARMGKQAREIGKLYKNRVEVVVAVSSHVPKPHTPFQWCAMDHPDELARKQDLLRNLSRKWNYIFRHHEFRVSHLEGIIARGDIRHASLIEKAWRLGARFDGWDEKLNWDVWQTALDEWEQEVGVERFQFLGTLPLDGRLSWDHIDVGLDDGFLEKEYKKAIASRLSPPCGKPLQAKVHHTNLEDARAEQRKLVCYHCGIACDLTQMREERIDFLTKLGAELRPESRAEPNAHQNAMKRFQSGKTPHDFQQGERIRYRLRFTKLNPLHMQGHHDLLRLIPRIMRRAKFPVYYSEGFKPKPVISFGPALSLGIQSLNEYADIALHTEMAVDEMITKMNEFTQEGLIITGVRRLGKQDSGLSKILRGVEYLVGLSDQSIQDIQTFLNGEDLLSGIRARLQEVNDCETFPLSITRKIKTKIVDLRQQLLSLELLKGSELPEAAGFEAEQLVIRIQLKEADGPSIRPAEVMRALFETEVFLGQIVRSRCLARNKEGHYTEPLDFTRDPHTPAVAQRSLETEEYTYQAFVPPVASAPTQDSNNA